MSKIITRAEAIVKGQKHYFTGKPCQHGHLAKRFVTSFGCFDCSADLRRNTDKSVLKERVQSWRVNNRDQRNEQASRWYYANREKSIGFTRNWQKDNQGKVCEGKRTWYATEKGRESAIKWRLANPEKVRATQGRRWARKQASVGTFSADDILTMLVAQHGRCAGPHCGVDISVAYSIDHMVPLSRGGSNWPDNLQLLCSSCNSSKRDRTMQEWLASLTRRGIALRCEAVA